MLLKEMYNRFRDRLTPRIPNSKRKFDRLNIGDLLVFKTTYLPARRKVLDFDEYNHPIVNFHGKKEAIDPVLFVKFFSRGMQ